MLTGGAGSKNEGPPLPSPLLPRREERESALLPNSMAVATGRAIEFAPTDACLLPRPARNERGEGWGEGPIDAHWRR